ncbi:DUF2156 domain-containing protein [candidate division WWE3 bacterium]|nr:DUF2156 domain-containing protein [candidate division WWE3 bacterium]
MNKIIPEFPEAIPLNLQMQPIFDEFHQQFNLATTATSLSNLFLLDSENKTTVSTLLGNLLIQRKEDSYPRPSTFVIGNLHIDEVLNQLAQHGIGYIDQYPWELPNAQVDLDNSEYLYSVAEMKAMNGHTYSGMRRKIRLFERYPSIECIPVKTNNLFEVTEFDELWRDQYQKRHTIDDALHEEKAAFEKSLLFYTPLHLQTHALYVQNTLVGYCIGEILFSHVYAIHFFKTNTAYTGAGEFLFHAIAQMLPSQVDLINFQQDLGIKGLRQFKQSLSPMKKITVYTVPTTH